LEKNLYGLGYAHQSHFLGGHAGLFFKGRKPEDKPDERNPPLTLKNTLSTGGKDGRLWN
jgi:hypothetical protein